VHSGDATIASVGVRFAVRVRMNAKLIPKPSSHHRWACFACRFSAKSDRRADVRSLVKRPRCPTCRATLVWTGTAFRPPPRDDEEAWELARKIVETGYRFVSTRERRDLPKRLKDFAAWLHRPEDPLWLAETTLAWTPRTADAAEVRAGRRVLRDHEPLLVWCNRRWCRAQLRLWGDGRKPLPTPVVVVASPRRVLILDDDLRVRLTARR
jgi:hypothetical protein